LGSHYLNPSASDPKIRNAAAWLLPIDWYGLVERDVHQRHDGTATTMVAMAADDP
jgi:hypothetical protein